MLPIFITIRFFDLLDILLTAFLLYQLYMLIRGTVAINIFIGVFLIYLMWLIVKALNMELLSSILGQFIGVGVIALIIVFQEELRRALVLIGTKYFANSKISFAKIFPLLDDNQENIKVRSIVKACRAMSISKTGALIAIEKQTKLSSLIQLKDILDARTSSRLIVSIFNKTSPLHDGAVIIKGEKIVAARCVLPLTEIELPPEYGLRHRAGIGITEKSDAIVIIVSEETGNISVVKSGNINPKLDSNKLTDILEKEFVTT